MGKPEWKCSGKTKGMRCGLRNEGKRSGRGGPRRWRYEHTCEEIHLRRRKVEAYYR